MSKEPPIDRSEDSFEALLRESARITADYDADQQDLEESSQSELSDRAALRRVKGFSTQLQDISDAEYRELQLERVILIGVWTEGTAEMAENSLDELKALAQTAGSEVLDGFIQRRDKPDPATYIGSGKVEELRNVVASSGADTVICDGELSPSQLQQLEGKLKVKVVDRTALILDIFAQHAKSK
jgi:GTP-binding protein HflX